MQCPLTSPGCMGMKFHFVLAAAMTSSVLMPKAEKMVCISLANAMSTSRWQFSMTLLASATRMQGALYVPLSSMDP